MNLIYMERSYGRYGSTSSAIAEIDATMFAMLLTLVADQSEEAKEFLHEVDSLWEDEDTFTRQRGPLFAFDVLLEGDGGDDPVGNVREVIRSLKNKGYFAEMYEEGYFAIAVPGKKVEAEAAMGRLAFCGDDEEEW